jgi:pantothenate synthetase
MESVFFMRFDHQRVHHMLPQALSISRSLKQIEALVKMGEVDANLLVKCIIEKITAAGGKVDYAKVKTVLYSLDHLLKGMGLGEGAILCDVFCTVASLCFRPVF